MPPWAQRVEPSSRRALVTTSDLAAPARGAAQRHGEPGDAGADDHDVGVDGPAGRGGVQAYAGALAALATARSRGGSRGSERQRDVVDQPGRTDLGGDGEDGLAGESSGSVKSAVDEARASVGRRSATTSSRTSRAVPTAGGRREHRRAGVRVDRRRAARRCAEVVGASRAPRAAHVAARARRASGAARRSRPANRARERASAVRRSSAER